MTETDQLREQLKEAKAAIEELLAELAICYPWTFDTSELHDRMRAIVDTPIP